MALATISAPCSQHCKAVCPSQPILVLTPSAHAIQLLGSAAWWSKSVTVCVTPVAGLLTPQHFDKDWQSVCWATELPLFVEVAFLAHATHIYSLLAYSKSTCEYSAHDLCWCLLCCSHLCSWRVGHVQLILLLIVGPPAACSYNCCCQAATYC